MCKHTTCCNIKASGKINKINVIILNNYYGNKLVALMRKYDSDKQYELANQNISHVNDNICYIDKIKEIVEDQYKIEIKNWSKFDDIFKTINKSMNYYICDGNVIFVGIMPNIRRSIINKKMQDLCKVDFFDMEGKSINKYSNALISDHTVLRIFGEISTIYL